MAVMSPGPAHRGAGHVRSTLHVGKVKAHIQFTLALAAKAINARASSSKRRDTVAYREANG